MVDRNYINGKKRFDSSKFHTFDSKFNTQDCHVMENLCTDFGIGVSEFI
jgi:hypothetical protein